jgi:putative membrane protein
MMWGYGSGMGLWGPLLITVSTVLFLGLVIHGVLALVRYLSRTEPGRSGGVGSDNPGAEQVLASRFAAGEIDEQEYRHRLEVIRGQVRPASRT